MVISLAECDTSIGIVWWLAVCSCSNGRIDHGKLALFTVAIIGPLLHVFHTVAWKTAKSVVTCSWTSDSLLVTRGYYVDFCFMSDKIRFLFVSRGRISKFLLLSVSDSRFFINGFSGGSMISQTGAPTPMGRPTCYFGHVPTKIDEIEKKGLRGGGRIPSAPLDPPLLFFYVSHRRAWHWTITQQFYWERNSRNTAQRF